MVADIPRLTRGEKCTNLILAILVHQNATTAQGWTPGLSLDDWAQLCASDPREVQRNRDYLKSRKMADCKIDTRRLLSFRLRPEIWQELEDYPAWFKKQPKPKDEAVDDSAADDSAADDAKAGNWRMSKPVKVARGETSKPYTPDCGVARIRFQTPADTPAGVDIAFFSVVKAGDLIITPTVTLANGVEKAKAAANKEVKSRADDMGVVGKHASKAPGNGRTQGEVNHPRAAELVKLFDPILAKSAARLLSGDLNSLEAACDAVKDCDHDYLVKFAVQRAERPVKAPAIVVSICGEALASWQASLKTTDRRHTRAEIDAMIEAEREDLARKRAALRSRK